MTLKSIDASPKHWTDLPVIERQDRETLLKVATQLGAGLMAHGYDTRLPFNQLVRDAADLIRAVDRQFGVGRDE